MKFKYTEDNNYFISNDSKIAFLNIPKNGSTSIRNSLQLTKRASVASVAHSFKFTVIRNPIDRFASGMFEVSLLRNDGDPELTKSLAWYEYFKRGRYHDSILCLFTSLKTIGFYDEHLVPQKDCLSFRSIKSLDELDFVINFEDIEKDFKILKTKINSNTKLLHHRKSDKKIVSDLRSVLTIDSVFKEFKDLYKEDFKLYKQIRK